MHPDTHAPRHDVSPFDVDTESTSAPDVTIPLRLLHLEDNPKDAELIQDRLEVGGLTSSITRVSNRSGFEAALDDASYSLILCDFNLPDYDGLSALSAARAKQPDVPVIVISGSLGEEEAVKCLHLGATDYLLKQRLERLPNAVRRAIIGAEEQRKRRQTEAELRASEERFRLLAQHSRDGFWFVGLRPERVLYVSPAVERIWGQSAERFYEDANAWWEGIDPADRPRVRAAWDACADGRSTWFEEEFRIVHSDGSTRLVVNAGSIVLDDASGSAHMSGLVRDITERTQLEMELRQAQKMEGIGQLAGGIAHDFNNLLTVIQANSDLALQGLDPASTSHADISEVKRAASSAAALTKQLLAFGRRQVMQPRPIELRTVTRGVESMLSRLIGDNIELVLDLDEAGGCVLADPGQIEQVIINLTVNARDAMPDGGRIMIGTATVPHHAKGPDWIAGIAPGVCERLTVTDTGVGMDRATRDRIFEPFFTTKPLGYGTGLGLSTVHGIVKQSGGELHVSSEPGKGTTFTIYLPQVSTDGAVEPVRLATRPGTGSETILLVEDQPSLRAVVRRILQQKGYDVLEARDGEDAIRVAEAAAQPIQLVITDVVMPGMNARAMAERIREIWPMARVLFMSGYHDDDVMLRSLASAKVDFLQKPFVPHDLIEKVREVLERV
jgi:two-component system, cell cycle sensor histidine kinase and response regulator CckA